MKITDAEYRSMKRRAIELARQDPNAFQLYVLRHERTNGFIKPAPNHAKWNALIDEHPRVVVWSHVEAAKTQALSISRVLWEIGRNPLLRVAIVSDIVTNAEKILASIKKYITDPDSALHDVFPDLQPQLGADGKFEMWRTDRIHIKRPGSPKDPTIQCSGLNGSIIGSRLDLVIIDDCLTLANTGTSALRAKGPLWYDANVVGRLTEDSRVVVIGTAWADDDLLHNLAAREGFFSIKCPVIDPDTGGSAWPDVWPMERIEKRRQEFSSSPWEFQRTMMCKAAKVGGGEPMFDLNWFDGEGDNRRRYKTQDIPTIIKRATRVVSVWDIASKDSERNDFSVCGTWAECQEGFYLLDVFREKVLFPDLVQEAKDIAVTWRPHLMLIESTSSGTALGQLLQAETGFRAAIQLINPGKGQKELRYAAETLAMRHGLVHLPERAPWLAAYESESIDFGNGGHHDDQCDMTALALRYFRTSGGLSYAVSTGIPYTQEGVIVTRDGEGIDEEVTPEQQAERRLNAQQKADMRAFLDHLPPGVGHLITGGANVDPDEEEDDGRYCV